MDTADSATLATSATGAHAIAVDPALEAVSVFDGDICRYSGGPYGIPVGETIAEWCGKLPTSDGQRLLAAVKEARERGSASTRVRISPRGGRVFATITALTGPHGAPALCIVGHGGAGVQPEREALLDAIQDVIDAGSSAYAVAVVDIPEFRRVVSGLGQRGSNGLLGAIGQRMREVLGARAAVHLVGPSEFGILLRGVEHDEIAAGWMSELQEQMRKPFSVLAQDVMVRTAIGVASGHRAYADAATVLSDAEAASLRAVFRDTSGSEVFKTAIRDEDRRLIDVAGAMRGAGERGELTAAYQPIIELETGAVTGFEALLRWTSPILGFVSPGEFIPIAEKLGWVRELDEWMMRHACETLAGWTDSTDAVMSVNVSARWADDPSLVDFVAATLTETGLPPERLRIEVTETAIVRSPESCARVLTGLRGLGVKVAMDDFGTGFASLQQLATMPLDVLKIDRTFIMRMAQDERSRDMVRAVIAMGHLLGMSIVAEGVETDNERAWLVEMGCDHAQGYFFDRPMPAEEARGRIGAS